MPQSPAAYTATLDGSKQLGPALVHLSDPLGVLLCTTLRSQDVALHVEKHQHTLGHYGQMPLEMNCTSG